MGLRQIRRCHRYLSASPAVPVYSAGLTNVPMVDVSTSPRSRRSATALPAVSAEWPVHWDSSRCDGSWVSAGR
jgi:hypothetical protein